MLDAYSSALSKLERLLRWAIVVFYVLVVVLITFQVVNRFWLHLPIIWLSDLGVICFIWLGFLTASLAIRHQGHFRMSALIDSVRTGWLRMVLELFTHLCGMAMFALLVWTGWGMVKAGMREVSPGLGAPMSWAYASLFVSAVIAVCFFVELIWRVIAGRPLVPVVDPDLLEREGKV
jgi:TRAP-type C4-dicarboxylate transport system permease small subunit